VVVLLERRLASGIRAMVAVVEALRARAHHADAVRASRDAVRHAARLPASAAIRAVEAGVRLAAVRVVAVAVVVVHAARGDGALAVRSAPRSGIGERARRAGIERASRLRIVDAHALAGLFAGLLVVAAALILQRIEIDGEGA